MRALQRKWLRDLQHQWLSLSAIALVLGSGIAVFVMATGMYSSLEMARDRYYETSRMADLAVSLVRAPLTLATELASTQGVSALEPRISGFALVDLAGVNAPVSAQLLSLPTGNRSTVNDLVLREGQWPDPSKTNEVLVNEAFAEAHQLGPGSKINALLRGRQLSLLIVGIASSPEFSFAVAPGNILPEPSRFGVLWLHRDSLAENMNLGGAFNDLVLRIDAEAHLPKLIASIDKRLEPYGGRGAYGRDRMLAARYLQDELSQLSTLSLVLPPIFLIVAVFLLNVVMIRMVAMERSTIGLLKAFGYDNASIGWHYTQTALFIAIIGTGIGLLLGHYAGHYMAAVYRDVYHLPILDFRLNPVLCLAALSIAVVAAALGAVQAAVRAARTLPAVSLSPPPPAAFRRYSTFVERPLGYVTLRSRILLRRLLHAPRRTASTVGGLALSLALLILSSHFPITIDRVLALTFGVAQRMHLTVGFDEAKSPSALYELARLPGVMQVEPMMNEEVAITHGHRAIRDTITGLPALAELNRIISSDETVISLRPGGVILASSLANKLSVLPGDIIDVTVPNVGHPPTQLVVSEVVPLLLGSGAYTDETLFAHALREPVRIRGAHLIIDAAYRISLNQELKQTPSVVSVMYTDLFENSLRQLFKEGIGFFSSMFLFFSLTMAAGVSFSALRITLSEQRRDLATLRVLGYPTRETAWLLFGEIGILLAIAIPIGWVTGGLLSEWMMTRFETDLFSFPMIINLPTYAHAALLVMGAVLATSLWVYQDIAKLDLIATLKSHE